MLKDSTNLLKDVLLCERCEGFFCQYFRSLKLLYLSIAALGTGPSDFECMCISSYFPSNQLQCQSGAAPGVTVEQEDANDLMILKEMLYA